MMKNTTFGLSLIAGLLLLPASSLSAVTFDDDVTGDAIFGSGNINGGWTVDRQGGVELGLRTHVRLPVPQNVFNSNGDGSYTYTTWDNVTPTDSKVNWNYDFSINSDHTSGTVKLDAYDYVMTIDLDPSEGRANDVSFDPFVAWSDNSLGDNTTGEGQGVETNDPANWNLAQNSQNLGWIGANGNLDATYDFVLTAYEKGTTSVVAQTSMRVIVGEGGEPLADSDGDGIIDEEDACPNSDMSETVVIGDVDSGVENFLLENGCTISDLIAEITTSSGEGREFFAEVKQLAKDLKQAGLVTKKEALQLRKTAKESIKKSKK